MIPNIRFMIHLHVEHNRIEQPKLFIVLALVQPSDTQLL